MPANSPSATATSPCSHSRVNAQKTCAPSTTRSGSASPRATAIRRRRSIPRSMIGRHGPPHHAAHRPTPGRGGVVDAATVMARCDALQEHTEEPGKLTRRFATPALEAATSVRRGMDARRRPATRRDAVRNLFGRYEGSKPDAPAFLLGSHLDSVPDGGRLRRPARRAHGARRGGAPGRPRRAPAVRARGLRVLRRGVRPLRHDVPRLLGRRRRLRRGLARSRRPRRHRHARRPARHRRRPR